MRATSTGPMTTLLMFVPLIAVPLLAVFGIPQFSAVNASPPHEERLALAPADHSPVGQSGRHDADDLFAPIEGRRSVTSTREAAGGSRGPDPAAFPSTDRSAGDPFHPADEAAEPHDPPAAPRADAMAGWALDGEPSGAHPGNGGQILNASTSAAAARLDALALGSQDPPAEQDGSAFGRPAVRFATDKNDRPGRTEGSFEGTPRTASDAGADGEVEPGRPARQLTWRNAVRRLNELGIRDYQLQPGVRDQEFHFSCWFTPDDSPRQTVRFEAEATEPLRAVEKVLAQIEERFERR